jgi:HlyD family secretion protein
MRTRTKIQMAIVLGCVVMLSLGLTFGKTGSEADALNWDVVDRGEVRETIQASGEIQARTRVNIGTNVAGEITQLLVKDGEYVQAGQLLVRIDPERLRQQLSQAQALLESARKDAARLDAARRLAAETYERTGALFHQGLVSVEADRQAKIGMESAEFTAQSAHANVSQNEANVAAMRDGLTKTEIRSPIVGRVTSLRAEKGEMAIPGMSNLPGAVLMVVSDMTDTCAEIKVNENEVVRLKVGQPAQVTVEPMPDRIFRGTISEIASAAEATGQDANMYKVKVLLNVTDHDMALLRPGMSARAVILTADTKNAVRVPLQAVLEREGSMEEARAKGLFVPQTRSVVMVANKDGKVDEKTVTLGIADSQYYEVQSGLSRGDKVITGPLRKLRDLKDKADVTLHHLSESQTDRKQRGEQEQSAK